MREIPDLWPKEIADTESSVTPFTILKSQAAALASRTQGLVVAKINRKTDDEGDFIYSFTLSAPTINYFYQLFTVWHEPVKLYPVHCRFLSNTVECVNQEQFMLWLGEILSSEETKRVVTGLLVQAREGAIEE